MGFDTIARALVVALAGETSGTTTSSIPALPPDPSNAALLYYQGFLLLAKLEKEEIKCLHHLAEGRVDPDDSVRQPLQKCRRALELAEAAADLTQCDWGNQFSQGIAMAQPQLMQMRLLVFALAADARVRMAEGDYRRALERCLTTARLARHIGNDTLVSYLVWIASRALGYRCMVDVIGRASDDTSLLQWLKDELATLGAELTAVRPLQIETHIWTELMRMDRVETFADLVSQGEKPIDRVEAFGDLLPRGEEAIRSRILAEASEESLREMRRAYCERVDAAIHILEASQPYQEAVTQLDQLCVAGDEDDLNASIACLSLPRIVRIYTLQTRGQAQANATRAGVEICLCRLDTGTLPETLPPGLPTDPFSGRDFEYERTAEGFTLRCRTAEFKTEKLHQYAFNVK